MSKFEPFLVIDEDDTDDRYTLKDLLDDLKERMEGVDPEDVIVKLTQVDYEDDGFFEVSMAELRFLVKK